MMTEFLQCFWAWRQGIWRAMVTHGAGYYQSIRGRKNWVLYRCTLLTRNQRLIQIIIHCGIGWNKLYMKVDNEKKPYECTLFPRSSEWCDIMSFLAVSCVKTSNDGRSTLF
mmetsp:Transcript_15596/g.23268  ORF Transcript_15596/g.23268 Transcript_15596/m.23268 type:complete len:111 (-) Transcript_15596:1046-1378(-)